VKAFFETETICVVERPGWSSNKSTMAYKLTPFRAMIWDELRAIIAKEIGDKGIGIAVQTAWQNGKRKPVSWDDQIVKLAEKLAPAMASTMFERIVAESVTESVFQIQDKIRNQQINSY